MNLLTHHYIVLLAICFTHLLLTFFVLSRNVRSKTIRIYAVYSISIAVWSFFEARAIIQDDTDTALLLWRYSHLGAIFIPITFVHFVYALLDIRGRKRKLIPFSYAVGIIFLLVNFTPFFIKDAVPRFYFRHYFYPAGLYVYVFFPLWIMWATYGFMELFRVLTNDSWSTYKKNHVKYFAWPMLIAYIGGIPNFFPAFNYALPVPYLMPFGNYAVILYALVTAYSITRFRFLEINIVIKRTLVYSLSAALLSGLFVLMILAATELVSGVTGAPSLAVTTSAALAVAFLFYPVKNRIQTVLDRTFFKTSYNYYNAIQHISRQLSSTVNLRETYELIIDNIFALLKLRNCCFLSREGGRFVSICNRSFQGDISYGRESAAEINPPAVSADSGIIKQLAEKKLIIVKEELAQMLNNEAGEIIRRDMDLLACEVAAPLFIDDELSLALILGEKMSGDLYTSDDINLLETVANQSAIAIKNARLYDELEERVRQRTQELFEMNEQLQREVSERRRAEKELNAFTDKLRKSNQELQDFAHVASHDLMEPLRKIITFGDRLKNDLSCNLGEKGCDFIERMQNAAERMQKLIDGLLSYSRVTTKAQPFKQIDLTEVLGGVLSDLEVRVEQTHGRVEADHLASIYADPLQMRQLFQNLIGNALKFSKENEPPSVKVHGEYRKGDAVKVHGKGDNLSYQITIEDNGIGFDEKDTEKIFGVFQRLHGRKEYEGAGIGLSVCKKIVDRHGGSITAKSKLGSGAKFIISLPVLQKEATAV